MEDYSSYTLVSTITVLCLVVCFVLWCDFAHPLSCSSLVLLSILIPLPKSDARVSES